MSRWKTSKAASEMTEEVTDYWISWSPRALGQHASLSTILRSPSRRVPMGYASAIQGASQLEMDALMAYLVDHTLLGTRTK